MKSPGKTGRLASLSIATTTVVRQPHFVAPTLFPSVPRAVCYSDTFFTHLTLERHLAVPLQEAGTATLMNPLAVVEGTTNAGYLAYVSGNIVSPNSKHPFVVIVDPAAEPLPVIASMGFRWDFKDLSQHKILMLPKPKGGDGEQ